MRAIFERCSLIVDQLLSAAARYACYLKGHLSPYAVWEEPCEANGHTRTLFWIVYVCGKGLSMVTGLPSRLDDAQRDLGPGHFHHGDPYPRSDLHAYVHLAFLQSRIQRELYSPHALEKGEADLIRTIRDLDLELDGWRQHSSARTSPHRVPAEEIPSNIPTCDCPSSSYSITIAWSWFIKRAAAVSRGSKIRRLGGPVPVLPSRSRRVALCCSSL
ncbi:hypothetical protein BDW72DRAFT_53516 [Aspergillus terricola var. indicus]